MQVHELMALAGGGITLLVFMTIFLSDFSWRKPLSNKEKEVLFIYEELLKVSEKK